MVRGGWRYWGKFGALAGGSLCLLFLFTFGILPRRFLLELDFNESGFAYPVIRPPLPLPGPPPPGALIRPVARGAGERFWTEYLQLMEAGETEAALELLEAYLEDHPGDVGAWLEYGRALWRAGRLEDAISAYRAVLAGDPDPLLKLELARLLVAAQRWEEALALYQQLAMASPGDTGLLQEQAAVASWAERYDLALALYEQLARLKPDEPQLRIRWAQVLYWTGRPEEALVVLDGLGDFRSGTSDSLRAAIERTLPPPPPSPPPADSVPADPLEVARALVMAGNVDSALVIYRGYLRDHPHADSLSLELADVFEYWANQPDSAVVALRRYLASHPSDVSARLRLARLLAWGGRLDEARSEIEAILDAEPDDAAAWSLLGEIHRWRGDRVAAAAAYRRALAADPEDPLANDGYGRLRAEVDAELSAAGRIGPLAGMDYSSDSEGFDLVRWRGGWLLGTPRTRGGVQVEIEELAGYEASGSKADLRAFALSAVAQRWWLEGELLGQAEVGVWMPGSEASAQPLISASLTAPNWHGASYRLEYGHVPAYRETSTLEASLADVHVDLLAVEHYRPLAARWDVSIRGRGAVYSGGGDGNLRADGAVGVFFKPDDHWSLGYETRGLTFRDPAPDPGRRLYWDPEWSWTHAAVLSWRGEPGPGWQFEVWASPGVGWLQDRDRDPGAVFELGVLFDVEKRIGDWVLTGRTGYGQSRADGYNAVRLELGVQKGFTR